MNRAPRIALLGATGTVGSQIAELIGERNLPYSDLKLFAQDSSDRMVEAGERSLPVTRFNEAQDLSSFDIAFLAIPISAAAEIADAQPGPFLIDLSAATISPRSGFELVAPGLTSRERVVQSSRGQIFAVPHPAGQLIATILKVLSGYTLASASIMLSASAAGQQGVSELFQQSADLLNARLDLADEPQVAFNIFAPREAPDLAGALAGQVRALGGHSSPLLLDVVRVPAFHGTGVTLFLTASGAKRDWPELLRSAPGLIVVAHEDAQGFVDAVGQEAAITRITVDDAGAVIRCMFDAARLTALTAIWIAEALAEKTPSG